MYGERVYGIDTCFGGGVLYCEKMVDGLLVWRAKLVVSAGCVFDQAKLKQRRYLFQPKCKG